MAEQTTSSEATDEKLEQRIGRLEEMLTQNLELRKQLKWITLGGSLVLLVILTILAMRIFGIVANYNDYVKNIDSEGLMSALENPDSTRPISTHDDKQIDEALKHVIREGKKKIPPQVAMAKKKLTDEVIPEFQGLVEQEFEKKSPQFKASGQKIYKNLRTHAETEIKEQLFDAMVAGMDESEKEIKSIFPEWENQKIEVVLPAEMERSKEFLFAGLHDWGTEKIAAFAPVLQVIDGRINRMTNEKLSKRKKAKLQEEVLDDFLEGFMDRIKYELIPGLGDQPAEVAGTQKGGERK